jgi:hypothetical protein
MILFGPSPSIAIFPVAFCGLIGLILSDRSRVGLTTLLRVESYLVSFDRVSHTFLEKSF